MQRLLDKFVRKCPFAVMTRVLAEDFIGSHLDDVFDEHRGRQYESTLKFSALAYSVADVTLNFCENLYQAYQQHHEQLGVAITSYYDKVRGTRPALSEAVVSHSAQRAAELQDGCGPPGARRTR